MALFPEGVTCEMEGAAIGQACTQFGIPYAEIRVISDTEGEEDYEEFEHEAALLCGHIVLDFIDSYRA